MRIPCSAKKSSSCSLQLEKAYAQQTQDGQKKKKKVSEQNLFSVITFFKAWTVNQNHSTNFMFFTYVLNR